MKLHLLYRKAVINHLPTWGIVPLAMVFYIEPCIAVLFFPFHKVINALCKYDCSLGIDALFLVEGLFVMLRQVSIIKLVLWRCLHVFAICNGGDRLFLVSRLLQE